jgi:hypothetical protein
MFFYIGRIAESNEVLHVNMGKVAEIIIDFGLNEQIAALIDQMTNRSCQLTMF